jgi:hypothetical protein
MFDHPRDLGREIILAPSRVAVAPQIDNLQSFARNAHRRMHSRLSESTFPDAGKTRNHDKAFLAQQANNSSHALAAANE